MQETRVWSLGQEDPLEKEMAAHSSILAWEILWAEEIGGLQSVGSQRVRHDWSDLACTQNKPHRITESTTPALTWTAEGCDQRTLLLWPWSPLFICIWNLAMYLVSTTSNRTCVHSFPEGPNSCPSRLLSHCVSSEKGGTILLWRCQRWMCLGRTLKSA